MISEPDPEMLLDDYFKARGWGERVEFDLVGLLDLPSNWDSYGASPVSGSAVMHAINYASDLNMARVQTRPKVTATPNGEVVFCWDNDRYGLEAEFYSSRRIEFVMIDRTDESRDCEGEIDIKRLMELAHLFDDEATA